MKNRKGLKFDLCLGEGYFKTVDIYTELKSTLYNFHWGSYFKRNHINFSKPNSKINSNTRLSGFIKKSLNVNVIFFRDIFYFIQSLLSTYQIFSGINSNAIVKFYIYLSGHCSFKDRIFIFSLVFFF